MDADDLTADAVERAVFAALAELKPGEWVEDQPEFMPHSKRSAIFLLAESRLVILQTDEKQWMRWQLAAGGEIIRNRPEADIREFIGNHSSKGKFTIGKWDRDGDAVGIVTISKKSLAKALGIGETELRNRIKHKEIKLVGEQNPRAKVIRIGLAQFSDGQRQAIRQKIKLFNGQQTAQSSTLGR